MFLSILAYLRFLLKMLVYKSWGQVSAPKLASGFFQIENITSILVLILASISIGKSVILALISISSSSKLAQSLAQHSSAQLSKNKISRVI